jgi:methionine-rich copper-binding protein CopC
MTFRNDFHRSGAILLWTSLAFVLFATGTLAHALLVRSEPEDGARLAQPPQQVTAWFSQELDTGLSAMQVYDQAERQVDQGDGGVDLCDPDHASMIVSLPGSLGSGRYVVRWTAASAEDGDVEEGEFAFISVGSGEAEATPASSSPPSPAPARATWPVGLIATSVAILLLVGIGLSWYARRPRER